jgi:hypothetical protein
MVASMLGYSAAQTIGGTNIKFPRGFALQDLERGAHRRYGRPVGTRTPDLYRVKAAVLCTANNLKAVGGCVGTPKHVEA